MAKKRPIPGVLIIGEPAAIDRDAPRSFINIQAEPEVIGDPVAGELEVGTNGSGEVVINLPRDMTGFITFSPEQATRLADLLRAHALEAALEREAADRARPRKRVRNDAG